MKNILKYSLIIVLSIFSKIEAQQVIKTDTIAGTPLTMSMDSKINAEIENLEKNCEISTNKSVSNRNSGTITPTRPTTRVVASRELTNAEICRTNPRIMGYKIQLAVVKSNAEANEVKSYFRRRFPNMKVMTDAALRPNYKILAGSYFNRQSASGDLAKVREYFKSAIPVQYQVFCVEAK